MGIEKGENGISFLLRIRKVDCSFSLTGGEREEKRGGADSRTLYKRRRRIRKENLQERRKYRGGKLSPKGRREEGEW